MGGCKRALALIIALFVDLGLDVFFDGKQLRKAMICFFDASLRKEESSRLQAYLPLLTDEFVLPILPGREALDPPRGKPLALKEQRSGPANFVDIVTGWGVVPSYPCPAQGLHVELVPLANDEAVDPVLLVAQAEDDSRAGDGALRALDIVVLYALNAQFPGMSLEPSSCRPEITVWEGIRSRAEDVRSGGEEGARWGWRARRRLGGSKGETAPSQPDKQNPYKGGEEERIAWDHDPSLPSFLPLELALFYRARGDGQPVLELALSRAFQ